MNRKLNMLGLVVSAALAMSAVGATTAEAIEFTSAAEHTILEGSQTSAHEFSPGSGAVTVSCTAATFEGTMGEEVEEEWTLAPTYTSCKDNLGRTAHVAANGCQYGFHATTGEFPEYEGDLDIACPESQEIEIEITNGLGMAVCTISLGTQSSVGPTAYYDENEEVNVGIGATNLINTTVGGIFNCGIANGEHTKGTYTGEAIAEGTDTEAGFVGIMAGALRCDNVGDFNGEFKSESDCTATTGEGSGQTYVWRRYPL